jgi:hypothetical protein
LSYRGSRKGRYTKTPKCSGKSSWIFTNPKNRETYRFRKLKNGTIKTDAFLGYMTEDGKLIPPT